MIDKAFWEEAREVWIVKASPKIRDVKTSLGGDIDSSFLKDPWEIEGIPFELVDLEGASKAIFEGGDIPLKAGIKPVVSEPQPELKKPRLDEEKFEVLLEKRNILDYVEACKLLRLCELPSEMDELVKNFIERMLVLQDAITKFESVYQADMTQFYEYYIPEALQLTATYIEYLDVGVGEQILQETEREVLDAVKKLLIAVNDTIDEIYKFASMEIKAKAKALESLMSQGGHVDPNFKIN